ncbi:MAG: class I SAM-dependent methyltransferase [Chloroflexi bacterium]|nr:class I SAM-dependent methyltransferase [Chloroflexota bacterium]
MNFDHFSLIAPLYARVKYSRVDVLREVASLPVNGILLDAGGGTGRVSTAVRDLVREAVIVDLSIDMLRHSTRTRLQVVCGDSISLPFDTNSFDRVIMVDALHHVKGQVETALELFRVVKPGGLLVIEEPDIRTFGVKLIALVEKFLLMQSHFLSPPEIMKIFEGEKPGLHSEHGTCWVVMEKRTARAR